MSSFFAQAVTVSGAPTEHVVWSNLTTYEIMYLGIMVIYLLVIIFQTVLLKWYADETEKMRKHAGEQSETIGKQYKELAEQNKILAETLRINTAALDFQRSEAEKHHKAEEEAHKQEVEEKERQAEPAFRPNIVSNTNGELVLALTNIKKNVWIEEVRANFKLRLSRTTPPHPDDDDRVIIRVANNGYDIMVGILYKRKNDSLRKKKVFVINTGTGYVTDLPYQDYDLLPVGNVQG